MSEDRNDGGRDAANLDIARAAKSYQERGFGLVMLYPGEKRPTSKKGWQHIKPKWTDFAAGHNIGIKLGEASGHLLDLDFDCEETRVLAALDCFFAHLPAFGRSSLPVDAPGHRFVICRDGPQKITKLGFGSAKAKGLATTLGFSKQVLLEIRGNGQTASPPSVLDGDDTLVWRRPLTDPIPEMPWAELEKRARLLAFCAFAARIYPGVGGRHDFCLALAGVLTHLGVEIEPMTEIMDAIVTMSGDDVTERHSIALDTATKHHHGEHVTGLPHFLTLTGMEEHERLIRGWLAIPDQDGGGNIQPVNPDSIRLDRPELHIVVGEIEKLLLDKSGRVFNRNGELVRLRRLTLPENAHGIRRSTGSVQITPTLPAWLAYEASHSGGQFIAKRDGQLVRVQPNTMLMTTLIAAADDCGFPPLTGVSLTPLINRDAPGYDEATGIYLDFLEGAFPVSSSEPNREDALAAIERLVAPLRRFPFVEEFPAKAAAAAAMIAAVIRQELRTCPAFLIDAPTAGTGKGKLAEVIGLLNLGVSPSAMSFSNRPEENEKRLAAILRAGEQTIMIDNVTDDLEGNFLCSMLTSEMVQPRILGQSETVKLSTRTLVLVTGNNLRVRGDMARRTLLIRLDSGLANPDERSFTFDPVEEVRQDRAGLVMDALTIVRAYIAAGQPDMKLKPFGSFKDFDLIRGALRWLDWPDPADTRDAIKGSNAEAEDTAEVIALFIRLAGLAVPLTVQTIGTHPAYDPLKKSLMAMLSLTDWNSRKIGQLLKRCRGVPMMGVVMRSEPLLANVMQWWVDGEPEPELLRYIERANDAI